MRIKVAVILIIALSIVLRFYHFASLFHWSMDEDYWAYLAYNIATGYHFPLIGGNIGGTGFNTTPYLIYLLGLVSFLTGGNPLYLGYFAAILGVITTFCMYVVVKKIFSQKIALISSLIYSLSAISIFADQRFWNPMVLPIVAIIIFFFSWKISQYQRFGILGAGLAVGFLFSAHGLAFVAFVYIFLVIVFFSKGSIKQRLGKLTLFFFIVALSMLPMLVFENKHGFVQTQRFLKNIMSTKKSDENNTSFNKAYLFAAQGSSIFYYPNAFNIESLDNPACPNYQEIGVVKIAFAFLVITVGYLLYKSRKNDRRYQLLLLLTLVNLIGVGIYPEPPKRYFLTFVVLPIIISISSFLIELWRNGIWVKMVVLAILSVFAVANILKVAMSENPFGYSQKLKIVNEVIAATNGKPFSLKLTGVDGCQLYGFRYLFTYLKHEPVSSYADQDFLWLYDKRLPHGLPDKIIQITVKPYDFSEKII